MPLFRGKKFRAEAQTLRNKYLMWRFRNYEIFKSKLDVLEDLNAEQQIYGKKLDVRSRVKQVVLPLLLLAETQKSKEDLADFALAFDNDLQNLDEERRWEDQIEIGLHLLEEKIEEIRRISRISPTCKDTGIDVYLADFADVLEITDKKERRIWSQGLAKFFRKRTNFPVKTGTNNRSYVHLPDFYIEEMLKKSPQKPPVPTYLPNSTNSPNSSEEKKEITEEEVRASYGEQS
jgi:hypothetical protein